MQVITGVDDIRIIIEECKSRPISGKYKIFVLDECQMLTVQAWNAMLKILEEPPEYVIFLFCTTDPQKIIGTVLSRVQRFNFQRISVDGIYNRLKFILQQENITTYEDDALQYIARLAKGGMRDSITTLEKCLDYNANLTLDNVLKVTSGGITEQTLLQLTSFILNKDCKSALLLFNEIYMSGADVSLFIKLYTEYLENCTKYLITLTPDITTLSNISFNWLNQIMNNSCDSFRALLISFSEMRTHFNTEDLKIMVESWLIKVCR